MLCYWPTIHNWILKICPKFQVISSHLFEVDELLDEHWAKIVRGKNISTPIYVECEKMHQSKVCVQEFSYYASGLDIQLPLFTSTLWRTWYSDFRLVASFFPDISKIQEKWRPWDFSKAHAPDCRLRLICTLRSLNFCHLHVQESETSNDG